MKGKTIVTTFDFGFHSKCCFMLLPWLVIAITLMPAEVLAYVPKVVDVSGNETSIDGEIYENSEIVSFQTPVRYYYYKVLEEEIVDKKQHLECAEKWAVEKLPDPSTIKGLVMKVKVANDKVTQEMQQRFCEMLKGGREDVVAAYAEAVRLNGDMKQFDSVVASYKKCLNSPNWKALGQREPRKVVNAFEALRKLVCRPDEGSLLCVYRLRGEPVYIGHRSYCYYFPEIWELGEFQKKIDEIYYGLIDLKIAKIAADNQRMDASSPNAQDIRKMRAMTAQTKKDVRVTKRMSKKAEKAADDAAASAAAAAVSASSAAGSAAAAADSAGGAARSADAARYGF